MQNIKPETPEYSERIIHLEITGKDGKTRQLTWRQRNGTSITESLVYALDALLSQEAE